MPIIFLLLLTLSLSACGSSGWSWVTESGVEIATNQISDTYLADSDYQYYWGQAARVSGMVTAGNDGYYIYDNFYSGNALLLYCDADTATPIPLCSRPNCQHNSEDCSAWFGDYLVDRIAYASGSLYLMGSSMDEELTVNLYRISPDGQERELVTALFSAEGSDVSYTALIHRGYVYYSIGNQDKTEIFRVRLDGTGEAETVYAEQDRLGSMATIVAYGNYLYIQDTWYTDETYETMSSYIGRYCIQTGAFELLTEDTPYDFAVSETTLYYQDWTQTMALDLATGEETVLYESDIPVYLSYDGAALCLDNEAGIFLLEQSGSDVTDQRTVTVLTPEGDVLAECSMENEEAEFLGGDGDYYFCVHPSVSDLTPVSLCTRDSLLSGAPQWVDVHAA